MNELLVVKNLNKTFVGEKNSSISNISFNLKEGEKLSLIGPDGAGKTTLLRLLSGLLLPDGICKNKENSPVYISGFSPYSNLNEVKKLIGYMPQRFGLYEDLTVMENLELYADLKNIEKSKREELFETLLKFSGLADFTKRMAGALSGGMKQKLGLSCTLLSRPKILFLDEPSVGVDPVSRRDLIEITEKLAHENKIGVIWATSYLDEAKFFKNYLLLDEGRKISQGCVSDTEKSMKGLVFYSGNKSDEKRTFLNKILKDEYGITDATIEGDRVRTVFKDLVSAQNFPFDKEETEPVFEDFIMYTFKNKKHKIDESVRNIEVSPPDNIAIEAIGLTKRYGNFIAANNISFKVKKGEIFGLLGPNGAGKSTTFKMLCSLIKPTEGKSTIFGFDIQKQPQEAKKNFGYMAQKFSLFGNLSVRQNVEFFMGVYNVKRSVQEVIKGYDLEKYINRNASSLPLGYKQRLALCCALVHDPPVLFLDEPTSGVDPVIRREFWMRINNLVKHKTSVLVTTHFMDEAQFCDKIALCYKGKILVTDTPDNLKNSVKSEKLKHPSMEDAFIEIIRRAS